MYVLCFSRKLLPNFFVVNDLKSYMRIRTLRELRNHLADLKMAKRTFICETRDAPTDAHETAVNFAIDALEGMWTSDVPISVLVQFQTGHFKRRPFAGGRAVEPKYVRIGEYMYPVALAKSMLGKEYTPPDDTEHDDEKYPNDITILVETRTLYRWYTGLDGKCPERLEMDLVNFIMHQVTRCLGFCAPVFELCGYGGPTGYMFTPPQAPHHRFLAFVTQRTRGGRHTPITDLFDDPAKFGAALTGNNLYFSTANGPLAKLDAHRHYRSGRTIVHLDENTYRDTENGLMTHSRRNTAYDVGPIVRNILKILRDPDAQLPTSRRAPNQ